MSSRWSRRFPGPLTVGLIAVLLLIGSVSTYVGITGGNGERPVGDPVNVSLFPGTSGAEESTSPGESRSPSESESETAANVEPLPPAPDGRGGGTHDDDGDDDDGETDDDG